MARIKIEDLKMEEHLDDMELSEIRGGVFYSSLVSVSPITIPRPIRWFTPWSSRTAFVINRRFSPNNYAGSPMEIPTPTRQL